MPHSPNPPVAHTALYRRWRAQTFAELVGQRAVVETLRNAVRLGRVGHAYLFVGPRGTGKTSTARILAKAINCTDLRDGDPCDRCPSCVAIREGTALDVAEFDAASNNTVGDMRELLPRVYTAPTDLRHKVFIIDEVQRITQGWDVLLKTLEEPPDHVLFIFCTTDPSQIRPAVISRVQRFTFRPFTIEQIAGKLSRILDDVGRHAEPEAVGLIAELAAGGMRDAESMLDQLLASGLDPLTADDVREQLGMADAARVDAFLAAMFDADALAGVRVLDALEADGRDLRLLVDQSLERLRQLIHLRLRDRAAVGPFPHADLADLAATARRLAGLDVQRGGSGAGRFQLELVLLAGPSGAPPGSPTEAAAPSPPARVDRTPASPAPAAAVRGRAAEARPDGPRAPVPVAPSGELVPSVAPARPRPSGPPAAMASDEPAVAPVAPGPGAQPSGLAVPPPGLPAQPEEASTSAGPGETLARLRAGWPEIVARVSRNPANRPLIEACQPASVEGQVVILGFPEDKAFLRDIAERKKAALEEGISSVLGGSFGVRCVATNVEALPPLPRDRAGQEVLDHARRIFAGDIVEPAEVE